MSAVVLLKAPAGRIGANLQAAEWVTTPATGPQNGCPCCINADFTVAIGRLPGGEYIGLAAQSYYGIDGVWSGSATIFDSTGSIGTGTAVALGQPPDSFQPNPR